MTIRQAYLAVELIEPDCCSDCHADYYRALEVIRVSLEGRQNIVDDSEQ